MIITIDTGTTNTRIRLFDDIKLVDEEAAKVGVRNNVISGGFSGLSGAIKTIIETLLSRNNLTEKDVEAILASGMITSDLGLYAIDHVQMPAGVDKLAQCAKFANMPEIASIPFLFIPGVKNFSNLNNLNEIDMMRGEEVEAMGIIDTLNLDKGFIAVLPGSHNKIIKINDQLEIESCYTTLCGELIDAVSKNTIIKNSLPALYKDFDEEYLVKGCGFALERGFNVALFKIRVLQTLLKIDDKKLYSFFLGAVLANDVNLINTIGGGKIIIGGGRPLRNAISVLLKRVFNKECVELSDKQASLATAIGAIRVYKQKLKSKNKY
ncbi:MAG TPA: 2-dehydro-3-deoxygalactonokinase [Clostridia bacterium]